jgi:hypothetical protein
MLLALTSGNFGGPEFSRMRSGSLTTKSLQNLVTLLTKN